MNYFKCCDYPCTRIAEMMGQTDKIGYLFATCKSMHMYHAEKMSKKEIQCDLCKIETLMDEIVTGKTNYSNAAVAELSSEHAFIFLSYMHYEWWYTDQCTSLESARFWIHSLFNNKQ